MLTALRTTFMLTFLVLGAAGTSYGLWSCWLAHRSTSWLPLTGRVISDECRSGADSTDDRLTQYEYTVESRIYANDREHFGLSLASGTCVASLTRGQAVTVYYNPEDPADSVLKPGQYRQGVFDFVVGIALTALAVAGRLFERAFRPK
jgi:hypothetical protein